MKLKESMPHLKGDQINKIVQRIDTRATETIYWDDFLRFLEREGEMREMINDMRITQQGTTVLKEAGRFKILRGVKHENISGPPPSSNAEGATGEGATTEDTKTNSFHIEKMVFINIFDQCFVVCASEQQDIDIVN
jgi:hypothetical protein